MKLDTAWNSKSDETYPIFIFSFFFRFLKSNNISFLYIHKKDYENAINYSLLCMKMYNNEEMKYMSSRYKSASDENNADLLFSEQYRLMIIAIVLCFSVEREESSI